MPDQWWGTPSGVPIYKMDPRSVIGETLPVPHQRPMPMRVRAARYLRKRWTETSLQLKLDAATMTAFAGIALAVTAVYNPFFIFGLTLIARLLFYGLYSWRVELRRYEAAVATRSLAIVNVFACVAVTATLIQSDAIWRVGSYVFLVVALAVEVFSVRTWWTWWAARNYETQDPIFRPKASHLLAAFALLMAQYVAFGILWIPLLDKIILWSYHATIWAIAHPIEALIIIVVLAVIVVVTKVYYVIVLMVTNPVIPIGIMAIAGIVGIIIH